MNRPTALKDRPLGVHSEDVQSSVAIAAPRAREPSVPRLQDENNFQFSFDDIYELWFHEVCRWARALGGLNSDVEDIAQEVFIVVRRKLEEFDGAHPRAWLYRITQRTVSDYRRRAWFQRVVRPAADFLNHLIDPADGPREIVQLREAEKQVSEILNQMSPVRRTAFILYEIEGYSGEEIAELESVPIATIYTRLHHARREFLAKMADENGGQS